MVKKKRRRSTSAVSLPDACVSAARLAIAERGVENLSLRDVARRLGVSHQAPYKHFPSRDHLLAEVMRRCFQGFARYLDSRPRFEQPDEDLHSLGQQYLRYAREHPLEYQLMFSTSWPEAAKAQALEHEAGHAFNILRQVLRRRRTEPPQEEHMVELDALYIWSTMHGIAEIMNGECVDKLGLDDQVLARAMSHAMGRMGHGLQADLDRLPA